MKMSLNTHICRICLAMDMSLYTIAGTPLQLVYERLTGIPLLTADKRPIAACYMCLAQLKKSHKLMVTSTKTEALLTTVVEKYSKITNKNVSLIDRRANGLCHALFVSKCESIDTPPPKKIKEAIKTEEEIDNIKTDAIIKEPKDSDSDNFSDCDQSEDFLPKQFDTGTQIEVEIKLDDAPVQNLEQHDIQEGMSSKNNKPNKSSEDLALTGDIQHECVICNRQYADRSRLNKHIRIHKEKKPFECNFCQRRFAYPGRLKHHLLSHTDEKNYECGVCQRRFSRKWNLQAHLKTHTTEKRFQCSVCKLQYGTKANLLRHSRTHTSEKYYECDHCRRRFTDRSSIMRHMSAHTGDKKFECQVCKNRFFNSTALRTHQLSHTGEKRHQCHVCQKRFGYKSHFNTHLKTHEPKDANYKGTSHVKLLNVKVKRLNSK